MCVCVCVVSVVPIHTHHAVVSLNAPLCVSIALFDVIIIGVCLGVQRGVMSVLNSLSVYIATSFELFLRPALFFLHCSCSVRLSIMIVDLVCYPKIMKITRI